MAVGSATNYQGQNLFICTVSGWTNAETTITIPHGLGAVPLSAIITPLLMSAGTLAVGFTTIDATNIVLTKVAGTGAETSSRVVVSRPHSIVG